MSGTKVRHDTPLRFFQADKQDAKKLAGFSGTDQY